MDQRHFSPLSSENSLPSMGPTTSHAELPKSTFLSMCTGVDSEIQDLSGTNSVQTQVIEQTNTAVTHEHVQPLQHIKNERRITREVHTHDVYHRVLPIIETEILPARHFIDNGQNVREIPESEVWKYTVTGAPGYRQPKALPRKQRQLEPSTPKRIGAKSLVTKQEPILADKKTYMTEAGYPRTEYLWLHPPVFEDILGRTQPVLIPAGLSSAWKARFNVTDSYSDQKSAKVVVMVEEDVVPRVKRRRSGIRGDDSTSLCADGDVEMEGSTTNLKPLTDTPRQLLDLSPNIPSPGRAGPNDQLRREAEEDATRRLQEIKQ